MKIKLNPIAKIDTMQVSTSMDNIQSIESWDDTIDDKKEYIKEKSKMITEKDGEYYIKAVLNPSRIKGRCCSIDTYSEYKEVKKRMFDELTVEIKDNVDIERLDICFDTLVSFKDMLKLSTAITGLYALEKKAEKVWKNVDFWNEKANGFNVKQRGNWLTIYDKNLESNGNPIYGTRIEFRFIRQGTNASIEEVKKMDELVELMDRLPNNLESYEEKKAEKLYQMYLEALEQDKTSNFTTFVMAHKDSIATSRMCELLYGKVGMKGTYRKWLSKFRMSHDIEFLSKADIKNALAELKKAMKQYKKS